MYTQVPYKLNSHHIIPVQVFSEVSPVPILKKALEIPGFYNELQNWKWNRIDLGTGVHGYHPQYTNHVLKILQNLSKKYPNATPDQAADIIRQLADVLFKDIVDKTNKNPGKRLNEIYRAEADNSRKKDR